MLIANLGRRYERLLIASAPFSFAAFIILFIAIATTSQQERLTAKCYEDFADILRKKQSELGIFWRPTIEFDYWKLDYRSKLRDINAVDSGILSPCYNIIDHEIEVRFASPKDLIATLKKDAIPLLNKPIEFRGIEMPEKASLNIFGTVIKIELMTFTRLLQVLLGPLMLLWLSSLYSTRYRETLLVGSAKCPSEIFPHLVNMYPAIHFPELRRKNTAQYYFPKFIKLAYFSVRIFLLLIIVGPPVVAYLISLFLLRSSDLNTVYVILGGSVGIFTFTVFMAELLPWHYNKIFPDQELTVRK